MILRAAIVLSLLLYGGFSAKAADDRIWSALVLATKETPERPVPDSLKDFAPTIKKVFGYGSLYVLGEKKRTLVTGGEEWLVPTDDFFFKVKCLSQDTSSYQVEIELYRKKDLLVTTQAKLARNAPLYIRGPQWGAGQLIFLLEVR